MYEVDETMSFNRIPFLVRIPWGALRTVFCREFQSQWALMAEKTQVKATAGLRLVK